MALVPPPPAPAAVLKAHTAYPDLCGAFRATACWCSQPAARSSGADWGQNHTEVCASSACCGGRSWRSTSSPGSSSAAAERSRSASGTTGSPAQSSGRSQARLFSHNFKVKDTTSRSRTIKANNPTTHSLLIHNRSLEIIDRHTRQYWTVLPCCLTPALLVLRQATATHNRSLELIDRQATAAL